MTIGDRIKELREEKQITQAELAEMIGMTQDSISLWEKGRRIPNTPYLISLCKIFNVTTDYLLGREIENNDLATATSKHPRDELLLLQAYRAMSQGKKKALFNMLDLDEDVIQQKKIINN